MIKINKKHLITLTSFLVAIAVVFTSRAPVTYSQAIGELIDVRTRNSKTYFLGANQYSWDGSTGAIHYQDDVGNWQEIDNEFTPAIAPWDWQMTKDSYTIKVLENFTAGQIIEFEKDGETVQFQPMALEWTNDLGQIQQISMPQDVSPLITNPEVDLLPTVGVLSHEGTIKWNDAYGSGIDFEWKCNPSKLIKTLEIEGFTDLPEPEAYIIAGGNPVLRLNLIFDPSDVDIYVDGEIWDRRTDTQTFNSIEFRIEEEVLWAFNPIIYRGSYIGNDLVESNNNTGQSAATLRRSGNSLYISLHVPYSWLETAIYPILIDPTVDVQVTADANDGHRFTGAFGFDASSDDIGQGYYIDTDYLAMNGFHRWTGVSIEGTIDVAYVELYLRSHAGTALLKVYAVDEDNPAAPTSAAEFDADALTAAAIDWDGAWTDSVFNQSPSLITVFQELVDTYTISSDAVMVQIKDDGGAGTNYIGSGSHDWNPAAPAKLHIEYTVGGVVLPTVTTQAGTDIEDTTATGNGNITNTGGENCDIRGIVWDLATQGAPGNVAPGASGYANDIHTHGAFGTGAFTESLTSLPTGDIIYYRAYAHNTAGYSYGAEINFLTKPAAPTNVSATDGAHTDRVVITWTKSTGATDYHVWRDAVDLGAAGDVATFDDNGAAAPTITPGNTVATDGASSLHVTLSLAGASANNGTTYTYKVVASNATGDSDDSLTDTGYRGVGALTYQWQRSAADGDAGYGNIIGATTDPYNDTAAPAPTITAGNSVASDGTSGLHVTLSLAGESSNDGAGRWYQCILNATGAAQQTSASNRGYRGASALTYQWQRSAADADGAYGNIIGATTDSYNDTAAPVPTITAGIGDASDGWFNTYVALRAMGETSTIGAGRWYQCVIDATGAVQQTSVSNRGYRGVSVFTYQWLRSAGDADAGYGNLGGAITDPYNDFTGATDPDGRWYYATVSMAGAASQDTTHDRGYIGTGVGAGGIIPIFLPIGLAGMLLIYFKYQQLQQSQEREKQ